MDNTGRITTTLKAGLRRLIFGERADDAIDSEMTVACSVDCAHLLMLVNVDLLDRERASRILREIQHLERSDFAPLRGRHAPRGLYMLYEDFLIERLGAQTGGMLQLGRSRNDRGATILKMRLRSPVVRLAYEVVRLIRSIVAKGETYAAAAMPLYTHLQPAFLSTYGHYLGGIGLALCRDLHALLDAAAELDRCPLGAGAVGGTSLPIDPRFTAELLGFSSPNVSSIDAVASRDDVLRLLSTASILGVTLSRLAADLQMWSMQELGFLEFPDDMVGSSSMMPQKRNIYVLEHVQGRTATSQGALMTALSAMKGTPFTNSIAVGTEAASQIWGALKATHDCTLIMRYVIDAARPNRERMKLRATESFSAATVLVEQIVRECGRPFRSVHHAVGAAIAKHSNTSSTDLQRVLDELPTSITAADLDPDRIVGRLRYGGGAAATGQALDAVRASLHEGLRRVRRYRQAWASAQRRLDRAANEMASDERTSDSLQGEIHQPVAPASHS